MFNNKNQDLPITALCVVTDRTKCPPNYMPIFRSYDANTDTDLWKDGLFGRKINRFICYTKDYPINETYNVIEDIRLVNERENVISGFIPIEKCYDSSEKSFQKKVLCIKVSHRFFTSMAVSDIIVLLKGKRPPTGYTFIGEINNHSICIKISRIPNNNQQQGSQQKQPSMPANSTSYNQFPPSSNTYTPPIPPRPVSYSQNMNSIEQGYVYVDNNNSVTPNTSDPTTSTDFYSTIQRGSSLNAGVYNPLQGVPFELNPIYDLRPGNSGLDLSMLETKQTRSNNLLNRIQYDFRLEKNLIESV